VVQHALQNFRNFLQEKNRWIPVSNVRNFLERSFVST
jgi:hypothetical protein